MTEAELAARLARDLGPLAADAEWSATATAGQAQGHYTDAISDAKAVLGVDGALADATLSSNQLLELKARALLGCLERLELHYTTLVDSSAGTGAGAQVQKLSQVQAGIARVRTRLATAVHAQSSVATAPATGVNVRGQKRPDYSLGEGNEEA
ncbi:hypothetical protein SE17_35020 [Kouleothrix aurantiaca]|jgi:hypothetical protein|uniref:Uncharacterized protein n=1 Tax=Kouleothrix aurantiaca TaxID=186479 RepID=A0A0P9DG87_9CHLR|nr:hypothetical protein SE17_35020 [Kouleothrix aurantiaca]